MCCWLCSYFLYVVVFFMMLVVFVGAKKKDRRGQKKKIQNAVGWGGETVKPIISYSIMKNLRDSKS